MKNKELSEACSKKLLELREEVLSEDRVAAMKEFGSAYITIHRYVNGYVKKPDFGIRLYEFLKNRIKERKAILA